PTTSSSTWSEPWRQRACSIFATRYVTRECVALTGQPPSRKTYENRRALMRRLILQTGISIDGYVAALDKSHPWGVEGEDEGIKRWVLDSVWAAGAHLMGRVTYEEMAGTWPTSASE